MFISTINQIVSQPVMNPAASQAVMKVLIGPEEGWDSHVMRQFEVGVGGHTPKHSHPWPHINYILSGTGTLFMEGKEVPIGTGSIAFIAAGETHQFKNVGDENLALLCIVPKEGHQ